MWNVTLQWDTILSCDTQDNTPTHPTLPCVGPIQSCNMRIPAGQGSLNELMLWRLIFFEVRMWSLQTFSLYLTENTVCVHYKDQPVNAVNANDYCYENQRKRVAAIICVIV